MIKALLLIIKKNTRKHALNDISRTESPEMLQLRRSCSPNPCSTPASLFFPDGERQTTIETEYPWREIGESGRYRGGERINSGGNVLVANFFLFGMVSDGASCTIPMGRRRGSKQFLHLLTFQRLDIREIAYTECVKKNHRVSRLASGRKIL